jgi:ketosteroid isomerase-like protein
MHSETTGTQPLFYAETQMLFHCVEHHDFDTLAALCDDDFGIVDIAPDGNSVVIRDRAGWENWFRHLFAQLSAMEAKTYTDIAYYRALADGNLGYCTVEFCQHLKVAGQHHKFFCVATIIWKKMPNGDWKESRWHCSVVRREMDTSAA